MCHSAPSHEVTKLGIIALVVGLCPCARQTARWCSMSHVPSPHQRSGDGMGGASQLDVGGHGCFRLVTGRRNHLQLPLRHHHPGGGYLVVAASPSTLMAATGLTNVLGPFAGRISNSGETLQLLNNNQREIDRVTYGVDGDWPVAPNGARGFPREIGSQCLDRRCHELGGKRSNRRHARCADNFPPTFPRSSRPI